MTSFLPIPLIYEPFDNEKLDESLVSRQIEGLFGLSVLNISWLIMKKRGDFCAFGGRLPVVCFVKDRDSPQLNKKVEYFQRTEEVKRFDY